MAEKKVGIWLDHREAVIVTLRARDAVLKRISSEAETGLGPPSGSRSKAPYGPQDFTVEAKHDRRYTAWIKRYMEKIAHMVRSADEIFIFGPGSARIELEKLLTAKGLQPRIRGVEPADRLTEPQIAARVKEIYLT